MADYFDGCAVKTSISVAATAGDCRYTPLVYASNSCAITPLADAAVTGILSFSQCVIEGMTILSEALTQKEIDFAKGVIAAMGGTPAGRKFTIQLPGGLSL